MWRHVLCAVFVLAISFTLALAEDFKGRITKSDAKTHKISILIGKDAKEAKEFDVIKDVKVMQIKKGEKEPVEVEGGLTNELFSKIDAEKGRFATITTNDDKKVTTIVLGGGKKN